MKKLSLFIILFTLFFSCKKEPIANFVINGSTEIGKLLTFESLSSNCNKFSWNFGDGNKSEGERVYHRYKKVGNYTITLTASGEGGTSTFSKKVRVYGTTYTVYNAISLSLDNFCSFYIENEEIVDLVEHGTLVIYSETEPSITKRASIYYCFTYENEFYFCVNPFSITSNTHNNLIFDKSTPVYYVPMDKRWKAAIKRGDVKYLKEILINKEEIKSKYLGDF